MFLRIRSEPENIGIHSDKTFLRKFVNWRETEIFLLKDIHSKDLMTLFIYYVVRKYLISDISEKTAKYIPEQLFILGAVAKQF